MQTGTQGTLQLMLPSSYLAWAVNMDFMSLALLSKEPLQLRPTFRESHEIPIFLQIETLDDYSF